MCAYRCDHSGCQVPVFTRCLVGQLACKALTGQANGHCQLEPKSQFLDLFSHWTETIELQQLDLPRWTIKCNGGSKQWL